MAHSKFIFPVFAVLFFIISSVVPAEAKISIVKTDDPSLTPSAELFKGTIVLTSPDGKISIIEAGDPIPEIPSGSVVEIFDGYFTITTEEGDTVSVSGLGNEFVLANGSSATVICDETSCKVRANKGLLTYLDEKGEQMTIRPGQDFPVTLGNPLSALPTAAGEELGFGLDAGNVPDSRNIESSPSS